MVIKEIKGIHWCCISIALTLPSTLHGKVSVDSVSCATNFYIINVYLFYVNCALLDFHSIVIIHLLNLMQLLFSGYTILHPLLDCGLGLLRIAD